MLQSFLEQLLDYSRGIIPVFLFAVLISAILDKVLPESFFENVGTCHSKSLQGKNNFIPVLFASILGALIPLCTCGMLPLASKLKKKGASWLITISFLTAGNASSVTALFLTFVLGLKLTLLRFLFAVVFGILVAYIFALFFKPSIDQNHSATIPPQNIFREFVFLIFSFGPWVLVAIFIAAAISVFLKSDDVISFAGSKNIFSPFLLSISSFPFYFCAGADIPISKALLEKGAGIGSVLAFMTASPSVNLTTLIVYQKWLGLKSSIVYLAVSFLACGVLGLIINTLL